MVKFLKTWFRSKRSLERTLYNTWSALDLKRTYCVGLESIIEHERKHNGLLRKTSKAQEATIASLQRDLAAAHAKLLIQEETPPEALHGAGNGTRKKYTRLSVQEREQIIVQYCLGSEIKALAKSFGVSESTVRRILVKRPWCLFKRVS